MSEEERKARQSELPLVVVSDEHDRPQGLAFALPINKLFVEEAVLELAERNEPWFIPARNEIVEGLRTASLSAVMKAFRCLIPRFDGAILSLEWKEAVWDRFVMGAPRPRTPSEQQYSDRKLRSRR